MEITIHKNKITYFDANCLFDIAKNIASYTFHFNIIDDVYHIEPMIQCYQ